MSNKPNSEHPGIENLRKGGGFACVCVRVRQEMVRLLPGGELERYLLRIRDKRTGKVRPLTRDEELMMAAAPGTQAEYDAAAARSNNGLDFANTDMILEPPTTNWSEDDVKGILLQLERGNNIIDDHN